MKHIFLLSLITLSSVMALATGNEGNGVVGSVNTKTIQGKDAAAIMHVLNTIRTANVGETGENVQNGIEFYVGGSQEGYGNDDVTDHWEQISGKIGDLNLECESHAYMTYKVAKANKNAYKDTFICKTK